MPEKSFIVTPAGRHMRSQVEVVMAIYKEHGHVNRTLIAEKLALTKIQSSQLLREFSQRPTPLCWSGTTSTKVTKRIASSRRSENL